MDESKRLKADFRFLTGLAKPFVKLWYNYSFDSLEKIKGPYLLLVNHNTNIDPIFVGVAVRNQVYFVATENVMRGGFGTKLLMHFFNPIIHTKGGSGLKTVMTMLKAMKNGDSVCMFPEGNRSFNGLTCEIPEVTGELARKCGVPVITYRFEGGYLTQPRWSFTMRRGRLRGHLVNIYKPEELKAMTKQEVCALIRRDLNEDAYSPKTRKRIRFRGSRLARGLETAVFMCPQCGKIGTLHTDDWHLFCGCGYKARYDEYGLLTDGSGRESTVTELDSAQRKKLVEMAESAGEDSVLFEDEVDVCEIGSDHVSSPLGRKKLLAFRNKLKLGDTVISADDLKSMSIFSRAVLTTHIGKERRQLEIRGSDSFCALKYLYLYKLMHGQPASM